MLSINQLKKRYGISITTNHTGKMEGMASLSTSTLDNEYCKRNAAIPGSICSHCYAVTQLKARPNNHRCFSRNFKILTGWIIPDDQLPVINSKKFRFEAFGDLGNETQFINYLKITYANPGTTFTIWTKNPHIMENVFDKMGFKKPKNLIIVISTLFIDKPVRFETIKKRWWFADKVFNVFSSKEKARELGFEINCGDNVCNMCSVCYDLENDITEISELEKGAAKKAKKAKKKRGEK